MLGELGMARREIVQVRADAVASRTIKDVGLVVERETSRKVRKRPIEGVTSGAPTGFQERVLVVLVEPLLDLPQQLVVRHTA